MLTELGGAYERAKAAGVPVDPKRIAEFREYQVTRTTCCGRQWNACLLTLSRPLEDR